MSPLLRRARAVRADAPVHYYMSSPVRTVGPDDGLLVAVALVRAHRISSVVVVEGDRTVGVLARSELVRRLPGDEHTRVADRMTRHVVEIAPATPIDEACAIMLEREVHQVVVRDRSRPVGVLAKSDAVAAARDLRIADPVERWASHTAFTAEADQPVRAVVSMLDRADLGAVLVTEGAFAVGVFGRRERVALDEDDLDRPVGAVMSGQLIVVPPELPLHRAAGQIVATGAELAAVVGAAGPFEILTPTDVVRALAASGPG